MCVCVCVCDLFHECVRFDFSALVKELDSFILWMTRVSEGRGRCLSVGAWSLQTQSVTTQPLWDLFVVSLCVGGWVGVCVWGGCGGVYSTLSNICAACSISTVPHEPTTDTPTTTPPVTTVTTQRTVSSVSTTSSSTGIENSTLYIIVAVVGLAVIVIVGVVIGLVCCLCCCVARRRRKMMNEGTWRTSVQSNGHTGTCTHTHTLTHTHTHTHTH